MSSTVRTILGAFFLILGLGLNPNIARADCGCERDSRSFNEIGTYDLIAIVAPQQIKGQEVSLKVQRSIRGNLPATLKVDASSDPECTLEQRQYLVGHQYLLGATKSALNSNVISLQVCELFVETSLVPALMGSLGAFEKTPAAKPRRSSLLLSATGMRMEKLARADYLVEQQYPLVFKCSAENPSAPLRTSPYGCIALLKDQKSNIERSAFIQKCDLKIGMKLDAVLEQQNCFAFPECSNENPAKLKISPKTNPNCFIDAFVISQKFNSKSR